MLAPAITATIPVLDPVRTITPTTGKPSKKAPQDQTADPPPALDFATATYVNITTAIAPWTASWFGSIPSGKTNRKSEAPGTSARMTLTTSLNSKPEKKTSRSIADDDSLRVFRQKRKLRKNLEARARLLSGSRSMPGQMHHRSRARKAARNPV